jgi:hypothetical protein
MFVPQNDRLSQATTHRRVDSLFRAMATDFLLREQFVTNPSHVISQYVAGERLPARQETALNHVIYSVAASPSLLTWLRRYALSKGQTHVSLDQFVSDFSAAVASHGGPHVVNGLVNAMLTAERQPAAEHIDTLKAGLLHVFGRVPDRPGGLVGGITALGGLTDDDTFAATFKTEGTWTGTGTQSTWTTVDTGTIFTAGGTVTGTLTVTDLETWHTGTDTTGTDSTGTDSTGTEITGTDSTGTEITGTDSTGTDNTGTDFTGTDTTGTDETGTEQTGTDDGGIWGDLGDIAFSPDNYAAISLIALSQYAQLLARSGALVVGRRG